MRTHHDRLHPRLAASTRVDWCVAGASTHVISSLGNVGPGGAFIQTQVPAPVGAEVAMFLLTEVGAVAARGTVAWAGTEGMGISFQ